MVDNGSIDGRFNELFLIFYIDEYGCYYYYNKCKDGKQFYYQSLLLQNKENTCMWMDYSTIKISDGEVLPAAQYYRYLVVLRGSGRFLAAGKTVPIVLHSFFTVPQNTTGRLESDTGTSFQLGCIEIRDFHSTSQSVTALSEKDTEYARRIFYLGLDMQDCTLPYADPETAVSVRIQDVCTETTAGKDGRWDCILPPLHTSVSETLTVSSTEGSTVYPDVMVGEVWLAGGQSNMEFQMRYDADFDAIVRLCEDPLFRFYDVPKAAVPEQLEMRDYSRFGFWRKAGSEDLQYFSAVAYYFGSALRENLQVPIGIIGCNWGGPRSSCWMSRETLEKCGPAWITDYKEGLKQIPDLEVAKKSFYSNMNLDPSHPFDHPVTDRLMYGVSLDELLHAFREMGGGPVFAVGPWSEWRPNGLYEEMLSKVIPYTIAGVIWYQGESDSEGHGDIYADMMCGLIDEWRSKWGRDFPFLMTQLAPLGNTDNEMIRASCAGFPEVRQKQEEVTRRMEKVYLASTSDVGHPYDIHPKQKRPVGRRLALLALANVYGLPLLSEAPKPSGITRDGKEVVLHFENAEGGLLLHGEKVNAMTLYTQEGKPLSPDTWTASVSGENVWLHLESAALTAAEIRFADTPWYEVNLYNIAGIPAMPFTIEIPES